MRIEFRARSAIRFSPGTEAAYADNIEVALSCSTCLRNRRTVVIDRERAVCIKNRHSFDARVENKRVEVMSGLSVAAYAITYEYEEFIDVKDGSPSLQYPLWGRIGFRVVCGACGAESGHSTQSNMVRPWNAVCACGAMLYQETGQLPVFECWALRNQPSR
jgi:hypothetical protein